MFLVILGAIVLIFVFILSSIFPNITKYTKGLFGLPLAFADVSSGTTGGGTTGGGPGGGPGGGGNSGGGGEGAGSCGNCANCGPCF